MINPYHNVDVQTRVESASPHELISMLLQGAKTNISAAQTHLVRNQIVKKGEHIGKAINILEGLRTSLNHDGGGDISQNLDKLYEYMQQLLLKANLHNDEKYLKEVNGLLDNIYTAWLGIKN